MDKFNGVPGPWMVVEDERANVIKVVEEDGYDPGFYTEICEVGQSIAEANLIAAAPDLLEALQRLTFLHACEQEGLSSGQPLPSDWFAAVDKAKAAIRKALG